MIRPTHQDAEGNPCFPEGVPDAVPLAPGYWDAVDLAAARAQKKAEIKSQRAVHEFGGLSVAPHGTFDTDPESQRKINGSVTMATLLGAAFTIDWRMADNSIVTLDHDGMIAVGLAVGQHVSACQDQKNILDAQIDAAETIEDIAAVQWPT